MKKIKYILPFILALIIFGGTKAVAQSTTKSFTSTLPFGNTDQLQLYNAVRLSAGGGGGSSSVTVTSGTVSIQPATVAYSSSSVTTSGFVSTGVNSVMFTTSPTFSGVINGVSRDPNTVISITAPLNSTLGQINYTVSAGSLIIDTVKP